MSTQTNFYIPKAGLRVVDPATGQPLPEAGAAVQGHPEYWIRRVNDGDVTERKNDAALATPPARKQQ